MNEYSTDLSIIQQRMYKEAAEVYRQYLEDDISSLDVFDPLILMLINACASEFKIFADEMESSKARMLQHLSSLLIPDTYLGPIPFHAIAFAPVQEVNFHTNKFKDEFSYLSPSRKNIGFTPAGNFPLVCGEVKYLASGRTFFSLEGPTNKKWLFESIRGNQLSLNSFWIGLSLTDRENSISSLTFYFDVPFESNPKYLDDLLKSSKWEINGDEIKINSGLIEETSEILPLLVKKFHEARKNEQGIIDFYNNKFITISTSNKESFASMKQKSCPEELIHCFGEENIASQVTEDLLWIKLDFPRIGSFSDNGLEDFLYKLVCQINCFPIVNRTLESSKFSINRDINMFSLVTSGKEFYCVEEVKSSLEGRRYDEIPFTKITKEDWDPNNHEGSLIYSLRKEGVQRFDKRSSLVLLENIFQIIREEALLYNALGKNIISQNLKKIKNSIRDIREKLSAAKKEGNLKQKVFITFPSSLEEYVVVRYWTTNGITAKGIPAGESLVPNESTSDGYEQKGIQLLTSTTGGRNSLLESENLNLFKSALVVKDRIVTKEDIKIYCLQEVEEDIEFIDVKKSAKIGPDIQTGLISIIDVTIHLREGNDQSHKISLARRLSVELNKNSACYIPIEVSIK